jgi:hypothetical protein
MKTILQLISLAGLLLTIVPPVMFFYGAVSHSLQNLLMLAGALLWFAGASLWLGKKEPFSGK